MKARKLALASLLLIGVIILAGCTGGGPSSTAAATEIGQRLDSIQSWRNPAQAIGYMENPVTAVISLTEGGTTLTDTDDWSHADLLMTYGGPFAADVSTCPTQCSIGDKLISVNGNSATVVQTIALVTSEGAITGTYKSYWRRSDGWKMYKADLSANVL